MARGKEKEQPTVVFRDTLTHEKPEIFGTMYADTHIQSAPEFSSYSSIMMLNAHNISMVRTVWRAVKERGPLRPRNNKNHGATNALEH